MSSRAQEDYAAVLPAVLVTMELPAELDVLFLGREQGGGLKG